MPAPFSPRRPTGPVRWLPLLLLLAGFQPADLAAQGEALTLERIFESPDFAAEGFGPARWLGEGRYTTVEPSAEVRGGVDIVAYEAATGEREVLVPASALVPAGGDGPLGVEGYEWSADGSRLLVFTNTRRVWRDNTRGDYWVLDRESGDLTQVGADFPETTLMFAKFSPDGERVAYVQAHDIYVQDLATGGVRPLTRDGSRTTINGTFDWVYEEEFHLQDGFRWSPDGTRIAYWQLDATGIRDFLLINNTDSLYSFTIPVQYPKTGTTNSAARVGVVPAAGGETVWMELEGDPRNNYPARMAWAASSEEIVIQYLNRLQNHNQVLLADAGTGAVRTVYADTDDAWLDVVDHLVWLDGGRSFTWVSESDGWRRVYRVRRDGSVVTPLTPGGEDVLSVALVDEAGGWLYYLASPDDPTSRYLYRAPLDGRPEAAERLTPADAPGTHAYQIAPGGGWALHTASTFDAPPSTSLVRLPGHRTVRTLVSNDRLRARVDGLRSDPTEFFRVETVDGVILDGWVMTQPGFDPARLYPVLVYVYGEPWNQTVTDEWYGRRTLWHRYLTQQGYVVLSLDPRGTPAPRGRDWRKVVYGEVGTLASRDVAMGVTALLEERPWLDPDRVAIWGWSGGGSMTLNGMFRYPEIFGTGMSVAPVPDQRFYDTIYQERYMGLPQDNPEGYRGGSPITYAAGLEGNLLLVHGTGDDNVHYQGTETLINRLIELGKPFDMMAYPNRSHGIYEGEGTTLHLHALLTRYLMGHVPTGPR
ncbi:MAG: DPP IV N-terminal domain-containing protein [Gemmatimonadota bacterium]